MGYLYKRTLNSKHLMHVTIKCENCQIINKDNVQKVIRVYKYLANNKQT